MSGKGDVSDILELGDERLRTPSQLVSAARMTADDALLREYAPLIATLEDFRRQNGFGRCESLLAIPSLSSASCTPPRRLSLTASPIQELFLGRYPRLKSVRWSA